MNSQKKPAFLSFMSFLVLLAFSSCSRNTSTDSVTERGSPTLLVVHEDAGPPDPNEDPNIWSLSRANEFSDLSPHRMSGPSFMVMPDFKGIVSKVTSKGLPINRHVNSGVILDIEIISQDQERYIIEGFRSGKHAEEDIKVLIDRGELELPYEIYILRDTIYVN